MQDALLALTKYWTDRGCMMAQPFNTEVGAGTMNPATILRVLGPEPWRVAYVEPSVRPDDARYGENPNRMQMHTQFQVILKPDPGNPQEIYLASLEALGIDVRAHDIRFVEDNWASPALGAWGLGWEVWLDGLEITQFTYFQQAGGISLDPVSVEITYGIERILMALQGVTHFNDIAYAPGVSYGEVFGQSEYEMSRYYLDDADIDANRSLFETYAAEAERMIAQRLPVPAHSYVLKCSHVFNVLDARGAISTTERAQAFARMRGLAREVASLWMARREELGHPLGTGVPSAPAELLLPEVTEAPLAAPDEPASLLFEIGTEEMPPAEVTKTVEAVRSGVTDKLAATRLGHGEINVYGTPRRVVVTIDDVQPREPDAERTVKGPKVSAAYDETGEPTKALLGFARSNGVELEQLGTAWFGQNEHVVLTVTDIGRAAPDVLSGLLADVVSGLRSDKNMRWSDPSLSFTRPIRWLTALLGESVVPVRVSALTSNRNTRVHRTAEQPEVAVPSADGHLQFLASHGIVADPARRRAEIVETAQQLAEKAGGEIDVDAESDLIDEVTNLVEQPHALLGSFDPAYLELPEQVLTTVMRKHQRYLPVRRPDGTLLPNFVAVANGEIDEGLVRTGNEAVLRARYEDASFFWRADLGVAPEEFRSRLTQLTFEERIGSMAERADRIASVAVDLSSHLTMESGDRETLNRAAALAKFDLASHMVVELPSLAGVMAREYAARAGETEAVAQGLYDMELPRHTSDSLPVTLPGALLALAERFDLLMALFALGAKPTGSSDPFGLRRAALGVIRILRDRPELAEVTIDRGLAAAAERLRVQGVDVGDEAVAVAREFVLGRFEQQLRDEGVPVDFVTAVLPGAAAPGKAVDELAVLRQRAEDASFRELVAALQRIARILPDGTPAQLDMSRLREPAEMQLAEAVQALGDWSDGSVAAFADAGSAIIEPVNTFFDEVLVMAEDAGVRSARLGLLRTVLERSPASVDWSALDTALGQSSASSAPSAYTSPAASAS
ncbi:glycine--tRNA ligase [Actinobacteria bacterium YIM 96077]|uniref:Multifunctional fusion protein n=1 Tax=Phytoactinopolyspora halophila TaxID=1981511 RepID=A0A329QTF8_9ACTN|nr:glycine--tRNA ligase [Phytoactinopolyspora halophila]AYY15556.1 glycine--tRNA ligase [Actinobacteria bacterium YIM 96077]RAW15720.1 glycine--tRNA ligase subunit alpha/beta [Phytoactinopolyspora halophila]